MTDVQERPTKGASFTNQQPRVATEADCKMRWSGGKPGERFRCYLCGHRFVEGDTWRWVCANQVHLMNLLVCACCDGDDVLDQWVEHNRIRRERFWWMERDYD